MENKFIRADDVARELSVSKPYAYKLIRKLNEELKAQGFNEGQSKSTSSDVRFTKKGKAIYAILMERPSDGKVCIKSFSSTSTHFKGQIKEVRVLGFGKMKYTQSEQGLTLTLPTSKNFVPVLKVILK